MDYAFLWPCLVVPGADLVEILHGVKVFLGLDSRHAALLHPNALVKHLRTVPNRCPGVEHFSPRIEIILLQVLLTRLVRVIYRAAVLLIGICHGGGTGRLKQSLFRLTKEH